jgi:hypothetical protein
MNARSSLAFSLLLAPALANAAPALGDHTLDGVSTSLRAFLVEAMPTPLYAKSNNWGNTKRVANGVKWKGKGLKVRAEVQKADMNDGVWTRLTVTTPNLARNLALDMRNLKHTPNGPTTFDALLAFDAAAEYERQNWRGGTRLYSGSARVRFRVKLKMQCEVTSRLEKNAAGIPDLVFRMRVVSADLTYDNLVCEHVMGLGGEAARLIGEAVRSGVHKFHPSLERSLLDKANTAIVKAADTKEVRVSLVKILGQ